MKQLAVALILVLLNLSFTSTEDIEEDGFNNFDWYDFMDGNTKSLYETPIIPPTYKPSMMPPSYKPSRMPPSYKPSRMPPSYTPSRMPPSYKPSIMQPSYKPSMMPPSYKPSRIPPFQKLDLPVKFLIKSLMKTIADLFFSMKSLNETNYAKEALPKSPKEEMVSSSSLVKIVISQLEQVFWRVKALKNIMKKRVPSLNYTSSAGHTDKKLSPITVSKVYHLFGLLKKVSEGEKDITELKTSIEYLISATPTIIQDLNHFRGIVKFFELTERGSNKTAPTTAMKEKRIPMRSLIKLASTKMQKMFWMMTTVAKMKMNWENEMMSGEDHKPKEMQMKERFMKLAMMRFSDTFWTLKKLKETVEYRMEGKENVGARNNNFIPKQQNDYTSDKIFEITNVTMWRLYAILQKCSRAIEELPMDMEGRMIWERLPLRMIVQLIDELIEVAPKLSAEMNMFKEELKENEDNEEYDEVKRSWSI